MQLQIRECYNCSCTQVWEILLCTISNESKVTFRSSKINIFVENNTQKTLTKTALVPTDNHDNYTVLKISGICLAGIKVFKVSTETSCFYSILKGVNAVCYATFRQRDIHNSPESSKECNYFIK